MTKILQNYKTIQLKKVDVRKNENVLHCLNTLEQIMATVASLVTDNNNKRLMQGVEHNDAKKRKPGNTCNEQQYTDNE